MYGTPDLSQYEQVTKGDIISAFANIGKPVPTNHEMDIESFSQDVWEPSVRQIGQDFGTGKYFSYFSCDMLLDQLYLQLSTKM